MTTTAPTTSTTSTGSVYLAIAPNIMRKTSSDLAKMAPDIVPYEAQIHQEMLDFATNFGSINDIPDLTIGAYPQYVKNALNLADNGKLAIMPDDLPPMRWELEALGMAEPSSYIRVIGFVPFIIAANRHVNPPITDWADLCRDDICHRVAIPPTDTPLPALFSTMMSAAYGELAATVIANVDTRFSPLDINKQIDAGNFAAGVSLPAFSRTYRENNGQLIWPASGAWPVPLVATLRRNPHPQAIDFLRHLLSLDYQTYLSSTGGIVPVIEDAPWPDDMIEQQGSLQWPGWQSLIALG